jgi:hypothetical protein
MPVQSILDKAEPTGIDLLVPEFNPSDLHPSTDRQELQLKTESHRRVLPTTLSTSTSISRAISLPGQILPALRSPTE